MIVVVAAMMEMAMVHASRVNDGGGVDDDDDDNDDGARVII